MTFGTDQKKHLLEKVSRKCWVNHQPSNVTAYIYDMMRLVKQKSEHIQTVGQFIHTHVLDKIHKILSNTSEHVTNLYSLLDRDAPISKKIFAWKKRKGATPHPEPEPGQYVIAHDTGLLLPTMWEELIANRDLARREIYPLFYRAIMDYYEAPEGKSVILDGAPNRPLAKGEFRPEEFHTVYFNRTIPADRNQVVGMSSRDIMATPVTRGSQVIKGPCPLEQYLHDIDEGDISAFFYVNKHIPHENSPPGTEAGQNIVIDSGDGDSLMIGLLHCRDRIDTATQKFNSRVWVKLEGKQYVRDAYQKRKEAALAAGKEWTDSVVNGEDVYVNLNRLYLDIDAHPDLSKAQYPQGTAVLLYILSGTDFFGDFSGDQYSLFYNMNWEKNVWDTWCKHADRFSHMLMMTYSGPAGFGKPELLRMPFIDEECMLTFIYQCYLSKYGDAIKKEYGVKKVTVKMLEDYTSKFYLAVKRKPGESDENYQKRMTMARKKRVPPKAILIRYIRLALLNLVYWINAYRPGASTVVNPLETFENFPYYGFVEDPAKPGRMTLSTVCSIAKPTPAHYIRHKGKHRHKVGGDDDEEHDEDRIAAIQEAERARREKEHARMQQDAEREERQRKMAEKRKRMRQKEAEANVASVLTNKDLVSDVEDDGQSRTTKKNKN